ncbi:unnamed protein product [Rhizoctonia solani]|uniref:Uncharacterized protein n=1 Tax=Rhizoctonia solani TaxID=456999 RepID=A0A8H3D541_9AGAM|nr:unnamed protein product [Rhizoctonia solani]
MTYDQEAIDFANCIAFGANHANAASAPPLRWTSLPTPGPNIPTSVFFGPELTRLTSLASLLPEPAKTRVLTIIEVTNTYQEHLPAAHPIGIWLREGGIPLVFARSPPDASNPSQSFWLPPEFFLPPGRSPVEGTLYFFEVYQDELREGEVILHKPSKTFYGGYTGVVCVVRALTQVYLNCLAVRGDFQPDEDVPAGYDISRFNVAEHDRIVSWIDKWIAVIKQHTEILSQTSRERKNGLPGPIVRPTSKGSDDGSSSGSKSDSGSDSDSGVPDLHTPAATSPSRSPSRPSAPRLPVAPSSEPVPGPSKQAKGKQSQRARRVARYDSDDESNSVASAIDFEAMDITSQDDEWSDEGWEIFHDRHLDDDVFPPDDPIGLYERYGFDIEVKFVVHNGCAPYGEIMPEDLWSPDKNEPLFGGFPKLEPYKAPRLSRPDTIIRQLTALRVEADRAKRRWDLYNQENPRLQSGLRKWAKTESSAISEDFQPLLRLLLIRVMSWLRAKAMAPYIYAHWAAMHYLFREAVHLFATSQRFIDASDFSSPEFTAEYLADQVKQTKLQVIGLGRICEELNDWHRLSVTFMEGLRGNWLIRTIPSLGDIIKIVEGTYDWIDAVGELGAQHLEKRPKTWARLLDTPFQPSEDRMNYLFGCPTGAEESNGLQDALEVARKMDPSLSIMGEVASTLGEMLSRASKISEQAPTPRSSPAATIETPHSVQSPPTNEPALTVESAPKLSGNADEEKQGMALATGTPSTSPTPQPKSSAASKLQATGPPEPHTIGPAPVVEPMPVVEPTQPTPIFRPAPVIEPIRAPQVTESGSSLLVPPAPENMPVGPREDNVGTAGVSSTQTTSPLPEPQPQSKTKSQVKSKATHAPAPPTARETRLTRKRKVAPETEAETEGNSAQGKRVSTRLQAKSDLEKVNTDSKEGRSARKGSKQSRVK